MGLVKSTIVAFLSSVFLRTSMNFSTPKTETLMSGAARPATDFWTGSLATLSETMIADSMPKSGIQVVAT